MKSTSSILILLLAVLLVSCSGNSSGAVAEQESDEVTSVSKPAKKVDAAIRGGIGIGDVAPDFELKGTDGEMHSFATVKDANGETPKGYIVTFTCNTCPYAVGYESRLAKLHDDMSAKGYPVVAIQPNDTDLKPEDGMEGMIQRKKEQNFNFAYLLDEGQKVYPKYGASKTPELYVLDADKVVRYHGAIDDSPQDPAGVKVKYVENAIAAMEKGEAPNPATVKAIGCSIKTKKSK